MNLPNILTVSRLFLAVAFIVAAQSQAVWAAYAAFVFFAAGAVTDFLDGYLARKNNLLSDFGKLMDPIADKFLVLSAFFVFMRQGYIADWMFWLIAAREVLVTASRISLVIKGKVVAAEGAGKAKTVLQMVAIFIILIIHVLINTTTNPSSWVFQQNTMAMYFVVTQFLMVLTITLTLYSGVKYFMNNRKNLY